MYLDEKYPEPPLLPCDLHIRAVNFQAMSIVLTGIQPHQNLAVLADSTILKLMEERSISSQHRQSLQHEPAKLRTKKIVIEVHIGLPLLYVCIVAFINIVTGHCLRT
ncbi:PREDICTED: vesicle-associated protein 2-2-like [Camelina sativa]|uniref:Vesicle-associated protein 2-2-like n=1 Tax=Camelina sativa TaxID=90675 RepID=A0ABM0UJU6_CAMSA|nr:PREDICTED: vesicle-associated protein 2-2-like [Camelina sativa]